MKQLLGYFTKSGLFAALAFASVLGFTSCTKDDGISAGVTFTLSGQASGSQNVPASSNSNGSGNLTGSYNSQTRVMTYTTTWTNLTGAPVSGGLFAGIAGAVGGSISTWSMGSGLSTSGSFSTTTTLNTDQEAALFAGKLYWALATTANASGEIRGQITATAQ